MPSRGVAEEVYPATMANASFHNGIGIVRPYRHALQPLPAPRPNRTTSPALAAAALYVLAVSAVMVGTEGTAHAAGKYYTEAQAQAGSSVFHTQCAICHGDNLEGKAGPALAGQQFLSVSQYQKLNADYLYRFMSKHMPLNAPGSLSKTQYLNALAYILKVNGYPSGKQPLTDDDKRLAAIKIEPTGTSQQSQQ